MALLVAVVQVVRAGVVEIDGLLHEAEPKEARVKVSVSGCAPRDGGDVMDAGHGVSSSYRVGPLWRFIVRPLADDRRLRWSVMWSWLLSMTIGGPATTLCQDWRQSGVGRSANASFLPIDASHPWPRRIEARSRMSCRCASRWPDSPSTSPSRQPFRQSRRKIKR